MFVDTKKYRIEVTDSKGGGGWADGIDVYESRTDDFAGPYWKKVFPPSMERGGGQSETSIRDVFADLVHELAQTKAILTASQASKEIDL